MKYILLLAITLTLSSSAYAKEGYPDSESVQEFVEESTNSATLEIGSTVNIGVTGQGISPSFARNPAQAFVLAKRAAMADAYRQIAERIKGVRVEGKDTIKNMEVKSSVVKTQVVAMIRDATIVETTFKDGLCEVEMEVNLKYSDF